MSVHSYLVTLLYTPLYEYESQKAEQQLNNARFTLHVDEMRDSAEHDRLRSTHLTRVVSAVFSR